MIEGVNAQIAAKLGLVNLKVLAPKEGLLEKLFFFVPAEAADKVLDALFDAGGGTIGNYKECSFSVLGKGTFFPGAKANPYSGVVGSRHEGEELKIELLYPAWLRNKMVAVLKQNHPYEEVAYELIPVKNPHQEIGSGITGELPEAMEAIDFLQKLKTAFGLSVVKHTALMGKKIKKISVCGGAGSFLIKNAINSGSDIYITSDIKYHEFFDAGGQIIIADIGHYESEQFTIELLCNILQEKFPNFAVLKTTVNTNPVQYF